MPPDVRVLVVDDSVIIRKAVSDALGLVSGVEVVGTASNGKIALEKVEALKPDVMVLDIEMPVATGFDVLRGMKKKRLHVRTIMFSTLTSRGASQTLEALSLGAHDYISKPTATSEGYRDNLRRVADELGPKIKQFRPMAPRRPLRQIKPKSAPVASTGNGRSLNAKALSPTTPIEKKPSVLPKVSGVRLKNGVSPQVVAIGISTGGPDALAKLMPTFSKDFPLPIVIVQHMPPLFTKLLAERLDGMSKIKIVEAVEGMLLESGVAYIAPGDNHLVVKNRLGRVVLALNRNAAENSCRPSADVLFRSVAEVYGNRALGVIMTGMGQDGFKGCQVMKKKGAQIIAQDEATSVVWGMPSYVVHDGLADTVLPLEELGEMIEKTCQKKQDGKPPRSSATRLSNLSHLRKRSL
ncbi:MAG: chemotaxis response regulator protein-glutamate methylesterase [Nitrospiria bacterium]